jgi:hypothetical protein
MLDRYIENSVTDWCASTDQVLTEPGTAGKGKAKEVNDVSSGKGNGQAAVRSIRTEVQPERLVIRLPATKTKDKKQAKNVIGTRASTRKGKEAMHADIEDVQSQSMSEEEMIQSTQKRMTATKQTVKRFGALTISIDDDESVITRPGSMGTSLIKASTMTARAEADQPYSKKDTDSRTRVGKGERKRLSKRSIPREPPAQPESVKKTKMATRTDENMATASTRVSYGALFAHDDIRFIFRLPYRMTHYSQGPAMKSFYDEPRSLQMGQLSPTICWSGLSRSIAPLLASQSTRNLTDDSYLEVQRRPRLPIVIHTWRRLGLSDCTLR